MKIPALADLGLIELRRESPLTIQLLPSGAVFALRHGPTLINQVLPGPAEIGLFRLLLRWRGPGTAGGWCHLVGPGTGFGHREGAAEWTASGGDLQCTTLLALHPREAAWAWRVRVRNVGRVPRSVDVLLGQDLGLADEGAVRNSEAYLSQYLDFLPVDDPQLGWVLLARQNQPMAEGRHPWLGLACAEGAAAFCTDGRQFFGADHRLTGEPAAVRCDALPSKRLQDEFAFAGLQSRARTVPPGGEVEINFIGRFRPDHLEASAPTDVAGLQSLLPPDWAPAVSEATHAPAETPLFVSAPWTHGDPPSSADLEAWFPGERRHEEPGRDGRVQAFFHGADTHVVTRDKEAVIARPHGHLLRSGTWKWIDGEQLGVTCYAAGVFGAQVYFGNPSFARLLPVVRNTLNLVRSGGQRVLIRRGGQWHQLGVPSAFAMTPAEVRWIYRLGTQVIEARVWCSRSRPAAFLELRTRPGEPVEFLISHQLVAGATEFDQPAEVEIFAGAVWADCRPDARSLVGQRLPESCFAVAAAAPEAFAAIGDDALLHPSGGSHHGPYLVLLSKSTERCGVILLGESQGRAALPAAVAAARAEFAAGEAPSRAPTTPLRMHGAGGEAAVARVNEILPWFTHNAGIHFSAPHGLEQSGGAAWGVRDVCQGSVEWLLSAGEFATVRALLETVFHQQYSTDGNWPQWFMHAPFQSIQDPHSHGDICFWPVKALCDYVEASNDFAFLEHAVGYTDPHGFVPAGPMETLLVHCDRVLARCASRFVGSTALVNYGEGDWDDTLQPADPGMKTRMISAWTVGLAFHTFRQLAEVCRRAGSKERAARIEILLRRIRADFAAHLMPDGIVAGFIVTEADGRFRPLLHPTDAVTGIRYRLLPMTRSILAELFTPEEATRHLQLIARELSYPDGVRLMSEPATYRGGREVLFRRAETAANVGREIGLQYVHAHLRYAEALAKVGDAEGLWTALQVVNPVGLAQVVANAEPRQSNVYFSSSDADFPDRYEAAARWQELRDGRVGVRGGWRLYSSGPGLYLRQVRSGLLGIRESFGDVILDPVLPRRLDGLVAQVTLCGRPVELRFSVKQGGTGPRAVTVNGVPLQRMGREPNPYRTGGLRIATAELAPLLKADPNRIVVEL
jgi:1,2-beta-oligoglucan phosphorylase